ncbi:MAG: hypothetical protein ACJAZ9_000685 [Neolewinella sp.]|jgi:hypothetical protein
MSTDKLEDFILNNREEFDDEAPADNLWSKIETAIMENDDDNDPLENFVLDNRDAFDDTTPPPRLEVRIFASMDEAVETATAIPMAPLSIVHRRKRFTSIMGIAATLLLLLAAAFTLGNNQGYNKAERDLVALELERIDPEMADAEEYYRSEIKAQFTKVEQVNEDPQLFLDLKNIDDATLEIREALLEVPVSQRPDLVNKLIETYRTKLDILLKVQQHFPSGAEASTTQTETNDL